MSQMAAARYATQSALPAYSRVGEDMGRSLAPFPFSPRTNLSQTAQPLREREPSRAADRPAAEFGERAGLPGHDPEGKRGYPRRPGCRGPGGRDHGNTAAGNRHNLEVTQSNAPAPKGVSAAPHWVGPKPGFGGLKGGPLGPNPMGGGSRSPP